MELLLLLVMILQKIFCYKINLVIKDPVRESKSELQSMYIYILRYICTIPISKHGSSLWVHQANKKI